MGSELAVPGSEKCMPPLNSLLIKRCACVITQEEVTSGNSMAKCLKALEAHKDREEHQMVFSEVTPIT